MAGGALRPFPAGTAPGKAALAGHYDPPAPGEVVWRDDHGVTCRGLRQMMPGVVIEAPVLL